jgi:D-amino-acid dehydrogenase
MKIAVVGAGVVGITTAYELAVQGHDVKVFERNSSVAQECSFANAGVISPGCVSPWAKPGMGWYVLSHLGKKNAPVRIAGLGIHELIWLSKWWRACDGATFARNRKNLLDLSLYSQQKMQEITKRLYLNHDRAPGYMVLLRGEREQALIKTSIELMRSEGIELKTLSASQALAIEPALNTQTKLAEAIYFPNDEVGNCREFAYLLKKEADNLGVQFELNAKVQNLMPSQHLTLKLSGKSSEEQFDAIVVCTGLASAELLRPLGIHIPLMAVHGYSISAAVREPLDAPRSGVMDERYKISITRLGQRVRVSGSAEIGGDPKKHHEQSIKTLFDVLNDWFPGAARTQENVQIWKGSRPMLPDGPPLVGPSGVKGVWLNLGHGSSGWALSCGSAKAVADMVTKNRAEINMQGFDYQRLK